MMPDLLIFLIVVVVGGILLEWLSRGLPHPWRWVVLGLASVIVLWWLGSLLGAW